MKNPLKGVNPLLLTQPFNVELILSIIIELVSLFIDFFFFPNEKVIIFHISLLNQSIIIDIINLYLTCIKYLVELIVE